MRPLAALDPRRVQRLSKTRDEVLGIAGDFLAPDESALRERLRAFPRNGELQGRRFDLLLGAEATKSRVLARSGGHRILHLAVHGYVDPEYPWFSGLALGGEGGEPCSFLSVVEIASMELDAELVFLSACETALGSILRAEGIKNTARAFLLAGAREVVATQWTVGDEASARLAQSFYRGYAAGEPAAEALRRAKLELIDARVVTANTVERGIGAVAPDRTPNELAHPAFWAPYVLWGRATR
jgi:CHAT domain-containing protein